MSVFTSLEHFQVTLLRTQPRHTLLLHGLLSKLKSPVLKEVHFDVGMAIFSHSTAWSDIDEVLSKFQSSFLQCITFLHECFVPQRRIEAAFPLCGQKGILQYRLRIQTGTNSNVCCSHRRRPNIDGPFSTLAFVLKK